MQTVLDLVLNELPHFRGQLLPSDMSLHQSQSAGRSERLRNRLGHGLNLCVSPAR